MMGEPMAPERDLRKFARSTQWRLVVGFLIILVAIGDGLIWYFYGTQALQLALVCNITALIPVLLIVIALWLLEKLLRSTDNE